VPITQNPSKRIIHLPLLDVGKNSENIEKATGDPPMPKPVNPRRTSIQGRDGANVEAMPNIELASATAKYPFLRPNLIVC
jgi:hypothetical protein